MSGANPDDAVSGANPDDAVSDGPSPEERRALFRVVRGTPDDAELAALTAVLAAMASTTPDPAKPPSRWAARAPHLRRPLRVGPDAWRTSTWPV